MTKSKTLVGAFDSFEDARTATEELVAGGVRGQDVSLLAYDRRHVPSVESTVREQDNAAGGMVVGVVGAALAFGICTFVPFLGPVLAIGPIAAALASVEVTKKGGALVVDWLGEMGVPYEKARYYSETVRRGGAVVVASVPQHRVAELAELLHRAIDIEARAAEWREEGWVFDPCAAPFLPEEIQRKLEAEHSLALYTFGGGARERETLT